MSIDSQTADCKGSHIIRKQSLRIALTFLIITAAAVLILSAINALTADVIAEHAAEEHRAAMTAVAPNADVFSELYTEDTTIDGISGAYKGTTFLGYCVEVTPSGFGGAIQLMVGVDKSGSVTGVAILNHNETPSLGANADSSDYLNQYLGKSGLIRVNSGRNAINAITGATITSKAVTEGVNTALTAVLNYTAKGGQLPNDSF